MLADFVMYVLFYIFLFLFFFFGVHGANISLLFFLSL